MGLHTQINIVTDTNNVDANKDMFGGDILSTTLTGSIPRNVALDHYDGRAG